MNEFNYSVSWQRLHIQFNKILLVFFHCCISIIIRIDSVRTYLCLVRSKIVIIYCVCIQNGSATHDSLKILKFMSDNLKFIAQFP